MSQTDFTISLTKANLLSILLLLPLTAFHLFLYVAVWGWDSTLRDFSLIYDNYLIFLLLIVFGVVAHELIHGLTWMVAGNKSWNAIKFGFNLSGLAPYAHCKEPLEINAYRWGAAMPGIMLGIIPFLTGLVSGNGWLAVFGFLFTLTASGDILILWLIRKVKPGSLVRDHPQLAGCEIIDI